MREKKRVISKKKKSKGFTLVELLIAISVLGLISILVIPNVSTLKENNKLSAYKKYGESLISSGKLYVDAYAEDLFGSSATGCVDISFDDLKGKGLVKDINIENISCAGEVSTNKSFVRVRKYTDHYSYDYAIYCKTGSGEEVYKKELTSSCSIEPDIEGPIISFTSTLGYRSWSTGANKSVTVKVSDEYGLLEGAIVKYVWMDDTTQIGDYKEHLFNNKRYEGTQDAPLSFNVNFPTGYTTQKMHLVIKPLQLRDANGNYSSDQVDTLTTVSNYYWLDNKAPNCTNTEPYTTWTNASRTVKWGCNDSESGCNTSYSGSSKTISTTTTNTSIPQYTIKDQVGNSTVCPSKSSISVMVDKTTPSISFGSLNTSTYKATITLSDSNSKISQGKYCTTTNTSCTPGTIASLNTSNQFVVSLPSPPTSANYTVCVEAIDVATNKYNRCYKYTIPLPKPVIKLATFPCTKVAIGTDKRIVESVDFGSIGSGTYTCKYGSTVLTDANIKNITTPGSVRISCTATNTTTNLSTTISKTLTMVKIQTVEDLKRQTVTSGNGLYNVSGIYRYRGGGCSNFDSNHTLANYWNQCLTPNTDVNNYFKIRTGGAMYRIMEFTSGKIKLVAMQNFARAYNTTNDNKFMNSSIHTYLEGTYKTNAVSGLKHPDIFLTSTFKQKILPANQYYYYDYNFYRNQESSGTNFSAIFTLPTFTEACYYTSKNSYSTIGVTNESVESTSCSVNNWFLYDLKGQRTYTASSGQKYYVSQSHSFVSTTVLPVYGNILHYGDDVGYMSYSGNYIRPIFYIKGNLKFSGSGTYNDPYLLWDCY